MLWSRVSWTKLSAPMASSNTSWGLIGVRVKSHPSRVRLSTVEQVSIIQITAGSPIDAAAPATAVRKMVQVPGSLAATDE